MYEPPYNPAATFEVAASLEKMASAGGNSETAEAFLALVGTPASAIEQMKKAPFWPHMESFAHTLPYEVWLCNNGAVPIDRLKKIRIPTLALAGGQSSTWAADAVRTIASAIPDGASRTVEGQSHSIADEALVPILAEFFAD